MEDRLDYLFQKWHQLGGAVLLNESNNKLEVFFHRVARGPLATKLTKDNALEIFLIGIIYVMKSAIFISSYNL